MAEPALGWAGSSSPVVGDGEGGDSTGSSLQHGKVRADLLMSMRAGTSRRS